MAKRVNVLLGHRLSTSITLVEAEQTRGTVFQALRYLGNGSVTSQVVDEIRSNLSAKDKNNILRDYRHTPIWMHELLRNIAT